MLIKITITAPHSYVNTNPININPINATNSHITNINKIMILEW